MPVIKPFKGIRPVQDKANLIASRPYDVLNREEARKEAGDNKYSFLHVIKPEIDFPDAVDQYDQKIYEKGKSYFENMINEGIFFQDKEEYLYIYAQTMNNRTQYGILACASIDDYFNNIIKKHELTRPDKEEDRKKHIRISGYHYEPVFFSYHAIPEIDKIVSEVIEQKSDYDFTADDGFGHHLWVIRDNNTINKIIEIFGSIKNSYVADGHHRTAAAALVGDELRKNNPNHTGNEEYNYFMAVHFPDNQLCIIDYNRVIKDLNGFSKNEFIHQLMNRFDIEEKGEEEYKPVQLHNFSMYIDHKWYSLTAKAGSFDDNDPIGCLDVTILSEQILAPLLDITDLRKSKRIDFVGGIRGLGELKARVDSGEMAVAFALYPVSMRQLTDIADTGNIMPPKTTWFEPKLRSGLVVHSMK